MNSTDKLHSQAEDIENLERKIYDLKNLIALGISLASNLDFQSLIESLLYSCIGQMFLEKIAILLQVDIDENNFYIHMTKGYESEMEKNNIILSSKSNLIRFFENNPYPYTCENLRKIPELTSDLDRLKILQPRLIVPMKSKNAVNGMLVMGNKLTGDDFTVNEFEFLNDLGRFAAIAVENSRLYLMATLDRMTRLYIHHYFKERLYEEIKRSKRNGTPLSLIISDIDLFKRFNDTYGHQTGDMVLRESASIFKSAVRETDIAARYGGEEFAVILPDTALGDAINIARRLRSCIESHDYQGPDEILHVTISLGVAEFIPDADQNGHDLIERADKALYKAKELGRNRVVGHNGSNRMMEKI